MALALSIFPQGINYRTVAKLGKLAEEQGFDGVFVVEGGVSNDAMAMAQAIAMDTQRITVGTGIANLYIRHPTLLGASAVAIDELSHGRFILGIGVNHANLIGALGLQWRDPRAALRETTTWLRQVFHGATPPGFRAPLRAAQHHVPIHFAGIALETATLAGEIADGLMLYLATTTRYQQVVAHLQQGARQAGRDPAALMVSMLVPVFLADDISVARNAARKFLAFYATVPLYARMFRRSGFETEMAGVAQALEQGQPVAAHLSDRLLDALCLIGPLQRCQEQLAALRDAGLTYPQLAPQAVQEDQETAIQRFLQTFRG